MKHLKLFESFSTEDMIYDIKDILLELEDEDFNVEYDDSVYGIIKITINANFEFTLKDVSDVLVRLFNYNKTYNTITRNNWRNFYIDVKTKNKINGAFINSYPGLPTGSKYSKGYRLTIGKDNRFYTQRARNHDLPLCVSYKHILEEVELTIIFR